MNNQEIQKQVLLNSDYDQINKLTRTSKTFRDICLGDGRKSFWKEKIQKDFPECNNPILLNLGSKKAHKFLYLKSLDEDFEYEEDAEGPVFKILEGMTYPNIEYNNPHIVQEKMHWLSNNSNVEYKIFLDINGGLFVQRIRTDDFGEPISGGVSEKRLIPLPEGVGPVIEIMEASNDESQTVCFIDINRRFYEIFIDCDTIVLRAWAYGEISAIGRLGRFEYFQGRGKLNPTFELFDAVDSEGNCCGNSHLEYYRSGETHVIWIEFVGGNK